MEIEISPDELSPAQPVSHKTEYGSVVAPVEGIGVSDEDDAEDISTED